MTKGVIISVIVGALLLLIAVVGWRWRHSDGFGRNAVSLLDQYERRQQVTVPDNIDEAGIRKIVESLLAPRSDDFPDEKLKLLGQRAVPTLVDTLDDPRYLKKSGDKLFAKAPVESVLQLLRPYGPASAIEPLTKMLANDDKYFRQNAALALGNIGADECIDPMKRALSDAEAYVHAMMGIEVSAWHTKVSRRNV